ncbi:MAG: hypothetical protein KDD63_14175, partial [Bacteroidetes bacterium]|nr:hypothetical protein [Bacteroidota bacterium]
YAVGISQSNRAVHMSGSQDNGTSILNDNGWIEWNGGDGMEAVIQTLNEDCLSGSWQYATRQRTQDGGQTRQSIGTPQSGSSQAYWVSPLLYDYNDQMTIYHFSDSVFKSDEFGGNWQYVGSPNIGIIYAAAMAYNNSDKIIAVRNSDIRLTQNGGQSWTDISSNLPGASITDVAFDPNNDNTIVVTYNTYQNNGEKVYISYNSGASWTNITHNLGDMPLRTVVIDHTSASNIYVGGEIGVYYLPMGGTTWTAYNTNLPNVTVWDLEVHFGSNSIKAATWGRGLWDYTLAGRKDYPAIIKTNISDVPTLNAPLIGVDQDVTAVISYANTLSSVYVKWSANNTSLNNVITMTNTMDSTWVSQTGIPGNFAAGTDIYFQVVAIGNSSDTTVSYRFHYTLRDFNYCISFGNMDYATAVTLVDFESINNSSGKTQPYTNYTATDSAVVMVGNSYDLTVNLNTDGNYTIYSKAWIDWNKNASFDDPGEEYDLGSATNTANGPTTNSPLSVTVPANAVLGKTTMRVSAKYFAVPTACEQGFDGEVEDYSIIVEGCAPAQVSINVSECDSYTSPSGNYTYTTSGTYQDTLEMANGCDSLININLTIETSSANSISPIACDSYTVPSGNATYTVSGIYADTLSNAAGCDSIISIDLTIATETSSNIQESACDSYTVPSGNATYLVSGM